MKSRYKNKLWEINRTAAFDKQLKKYRSDKGLIRSYKRAVEDLKDSEDPVELGVRKQGPLRYFYSYKLTGSYRLLYSVDHANKVIQLVAVGDHKDLFRKG